MKRDEKSRRFANLIDPSPCHNVDPCYEVMTRDPLETSCKGTSREPSKTVVQNLESPLQCDSKEKYCETGDVNFISGIDYTDSEQVMLIGCVLRTAGSA